MTFDEYIEAVKVSLKTTKNIEVTETEFKFNFEELKRVLQHVWNDSRTLMVTN